MAGDQAIDAELGSFGSLREAAAMGAALADFKVVDGVTVAVLPSDDGDWRTEIIDVERFLEHPRRKRGHQTARDLDSFIEYIKRHKAAGTVAWADTIGGIDCYLNDHEPSDANTDGGDPDFAVDTARAGWRDHVISLRRVATPGYMAWTGYNGRELTQLQFAEFLEDRIGEIVEPSGADLLEVATFFQAHTRVEFKSGRQLSNGQVELQYAEEITEGGGRAGNTRVPTGFTLLIRPYRDAPAPPEWQPDPNQIITGAKLRYRLKDQRVVFTFKLAEEFQEQLDGVHQAAIERVRAATGIPVYLAGA